jgi:DNA-binding MarR family transcriptional regulator
MARQQEPTEELKTLKRIELLLETLAKAALAEKLTSVFEDKDHRFIYEHTGDIPVKDLSKRTGLSPATISRLWSRWEREGLLIKDGKSYPRVL